MFLGYQNAPVTVQDVSIGIQGAAVPCPLQKQIVAERATFISATNQLAIRTLTNVLVEVFEGYHFGIHPGCTTNPAVRHALVYCGKKHRYGKAKLHVLTLLIRSYRDAYHTLDIARGASFRDESTGPSSQPPDGSVP